MIKCNRRIFFFSSGLYITRTFKNILLLGEIFKPQFERDMKTLSLLLLTFCLPKIIYKVMYENN